MVFHGGIPEEYLEICQNCLLPNPLLEVPELVMVCDLPFENISAKIGLTYNTSDTY
jgi:hypothetical protein